ncbi:MAG: hypothetical protein WCF96_09975 [Eubacteriales bacterium]
MEKFKDFIYDKNDIVIALVIVLLASFIILGRVNAIMDYPNTLQAAVTPTTENPATTDPNTPAVVTPETPETPVVETPETPAVVTPVTPPVVTPTQPSTPPVMISVTIPSGSSGDAIAGILVTAGFVKQKSDFLTAVSAAGAEKKLKAGTFKIPNDSNISQVIAIITK